MMVRLGEQEPRRRIPFRFKDVWIEDDRFQELVTTTWEAPVQGFAMYQFVTKLKRVKAAQKALNFSKYSNLKA